MAALFLVFRRYSAICASQVLGHKAVEGKAEKIHPFERPFPGKPCQNPEDLFRITRRIKDLNTFIVLISTFEIPNHISEGLASPIEPEIALVHSRPLESPVRGPDGGAGQGGVLPVVNFSQIIPMFDKLTKLKGQLLGREMIHFHIKLILRPAGNVTETPIECSMPSRRLISYPF